MNLYVVLSESLSYVDPILDDGSGPIIEFRICELVAANTRGAAKWAAWRSDSKSFTGQIFDMPRFRVALVQKNVNTPQGICRDWTHQETTVFNAGLSRITADRV